MGKQADEDYLWDIILTIKEYYRYETRLVVGDKQQFNSFILITIPVRMGIMGYISISATDICNACECMGKKTTIKELKKMLDIRIDKFRDKYGDI